MAEFVPSLPTMLNDAPGRIAPRARATKVDFTGTDPVPTGSNVLDRASPIVEIGRSGERRVLAAPIESPLPAMSTRDTGVPDDDGQITIEVDNTRGRPVTVPRNPATAYAGGAVVPESTTVTHVQSSPSLPAPKQEVAVAASPDVVPAPTGHSAFKRQTVTISSPTIGRHRLKVAQVLVSPSIVVIAYLDDEDSAIYEPPASGSEDPIDIEYDGVVYKCAYYGQSVTQPPLTSAGMQLLLVVLVRVHS